MWFIIRLDHIHIYLKKIEEISNNLETESVNKLYLNQYQVLDLLQRDSNLTNFQFDSNQFKDFLND